MKHTQRRRYLGGPRKSSRSSPSPLQSFQALQLSTVPEETTMSPMDLEAVTNSPETARQLIANLKLRFPNKSPGSISLMLATMLLTAVKTVSADAECSSAMGYTTSAGASAILMQQYGINFSDAATMITGFVGYAQSNIPINVVHAAANLSRELGIGPYEAAQLASGNMNQFAGAMGGYAPTVDMHAAKTYWNSIKSKTQAEQKRLLFSNVPYGKPAPNCAVVTGMGRKR